jgi:hypothetical protein
MIIPSRHIPNLGATGCAIRAPVPQWPRTDRPGAPVRHPSHPHARPRQERPQRLVGVGECREGGIVDDEVVGRIDVGDDAAEHAVLGLDAQHLHDKPCQIAPAEAPELVEQRGRPE